MTHKYNDHHPELPFRCNPSMRRCVSDSNVTRAPASPVELSSRLAIVDFLVHIANHLQWIMAMSNMYDVAQESSSCFFS